MSDTTSECGKCLRPMIRSRSARRAAGQVRHGGHGLCVTCYSNGRARSYRGTWRPGTRRGDLDDVIVLRLCDGDPNTAPHASTAERATAIAQLTERGLSAEDIAVRLGCTKRTVIRYRRRTAA